jgi:hypothetical protein
MSVVFNPTIILEKSSDAILPLASGGGHFHCRCLPGPGR